MFVSQGKQDSSQHFAQQQRAIADSCSPYFYPTLFAKLERLSSRSEDVWEIKTDIIKKEHALSKLQTQLHQAEQKGLAYIPLII